MLPFNYEIINQYTKLFRLSGTPASIFFSHSWNPSLSANHFSWDKIASLSLFTGTAALFAWYRYENSRRWIRPHIAQVAPTMTISKTSHVVGKTFPLASLDKEAIGRAIPSHEKQILFANTSVLARLINHIRINTANGIRTSDRTAKKLSCILCQSKIESMEKLENDIKALCENKPNKKVKEVEENLMSIITSSIQSQLSSVDFDKFMIGLKAEIENPSSRALIKQSAINTWREKVNDSTEDGRPWARRVSIGEARSRILNPYEPPAAISFRKANNLESSMIRSLRKEEKERSNEHGVAFPQEPAGGVFYQMAMSSQPGEDWCLVNSGDD